MKHTIYRHMRLPLQCLRYAYFQVGQNLGSTMPSPARAPVQPAPSQPSYKMPLATEKPNIPSPQTNMMGRPFHEKPTISNTQQPVVPSYGQKQHNQDDVSTVLWEIDTVKLFLIGKLSWISCVGWTTHFNVKENTGSNTWFEGAWRIYMSTKNVFCRNP